MTFSLLQEDIIEFAINLAKDLGIIDEDDDDDDSIQFTSPVV